MLWPGTVPAIVVSALPDQPRNRVRANRTEYLFSVNPRTPPVMATRPIVPEAQLREADWDSELP
jgi:hypothetical protein